MSSYRFIQLDVFASIPFAGNPLAVFPEAEGISSADMQKIAREMNLSETVFVLPSTDESALRRLRIFTPSRELPFAGHPIAGTWNALAREGVVPIPEGGTGRVQIKHEVGIGVLPVEIEFKDSVPTLVTMTQGKFARTPVTENPNDERWIAEALGLSRDDLDTSLPVEVVSTGIRALVVPVKTLEALGRCRIISSELAAIYLASDAVGCFAFTRETLEGGNSQAHGRFFAPDDGIMEDPATGSASGALSGYLVHHDALSIPAKDGIYSFTVEQGDFMGRPSRLHALVRGTPGNVAEVRLAGESVVVARGELMF